MKPALEFKVKLTEPAFVLCLALPAFFYTGFLVVLTAFQFFFDAVKLQLFLQLANRVLYVSSYLNFDHDNSTNKLNYKKVNPFSGSCKTQLYTLLFFLLSIVFVI